MTDPVLPIIPTEINLHKKSRLLEISFSDGVCFNLPAEYLRVFATEHDRPPLDKPVHGKQLVDITSVEPEASSALKLDFDDGFSAHYSWNALHELGALYERNWEAYLQTLADKQLSRGMGRATGADGKVTITLLYFIQLAKVSRKDEEEVVVPESVTNVETLLAWLRRRGEDWNAAFMDDKVQVTVNKHFAEPYTLLEQGDEVAIVPRPE